MMRPLFSLGLWTLYLVLACCTTSGQQPTDAPATKPVTGLSNNRPNTFVLENARVIVSPDKSVDSATVVVRDGHIISVGESPGPIPGAKVLDMSGKTIYPGLIDSYSETNTPSVAKGARHWNPGITPHRSAADSFEPDDDLNKKLRNNGIVARLAAPTGGQIKGTSTLVDTSSSPVERAELRRDVAMHMSLTTSRSRNQYPGSPMGATALVRQTLYDAAWYRDAWKAYDESNEGLPRPEKNQALATLSNWLENESPIIVDAQNERYALRVKNISDEFSLPSVIILGSGREYRRLDSIVRTGHPILVPVDFPKAPNVATPEAAESTTLQALQHWDIAPENPARLVKAGAEIALTSDGLSDKGKFLKSVRVAVKRGLEPGAALAALTTTPAMLFGIESRLGTIEVGKLASFVITDGDLFDTKTKIQETWVRGERYRIAKPAQHDATGKWLLRFVDLNGRPKKAVLTVRGTAEAPKAKLEIRKESYDLKKLNFSDATISGSVDAKGWDQDGVALVSFVLTPNSINQKQPTTGSLLLPDGTRSIVVAKKQSTADELKEEDKKKKKDDEEPAKETSEEDNDSAEESPSDDEDADEGDNDAKTEEDKEDDGDSNEDNDADEKDEKDSDQHKPALYDVNFPLGAYGRESLPKSENVLLTGATIWTCDADGIIENGAILIVDGKIEAVGRSLKAPVGIRTIDLAGKHITPGIIDCHSHIATDGGINESTQSITAEVRIGDFMDPDDIAIYRQLAGGVTSANILHGSANPIGGQNQVIKMRWGADPEDLKFKDAPYGIKFALGENVKQSNWGSEYRSRYPQTRMGVDEIMIDAFERAKAYSEDWAKWKADSKGIPPRVDLELAALAEIVEGKRWIHCHSYRQSEILALMRTCDAYGITIGSLQHILEGYKLADEMAARGITGSTFSDWWAYKFEVYDAIPYNGALMHQAGVIVSFNSDDAELGRRLNTEAAKAMKYGNVSPEEALKFVTLNPAKQLRIDDRVGSLTAGKDADLAVWSGPPMSSYSRCLQTWIDGRNYFDEQEDKRLRQRDKERHAALIQRILSSGAEVKGPNDKERDTQEFWTRVNEYCIHGHASHNEQKQK